MLATDMTGLPDPGLDPAFYDHVPAKRLLAWVVDSVLITALAVVLLPFTAFTALLIFPAYFLTIGFVYRTLSLAWWSATPGMALVSVEFRTNRGDLFDLPHAAIHTLIVTLSTAFVLPQIVSMVMMLTGPRAQGLGDVILGTAAINRPQR